MDAVERIFALMDAQGMEQREFASSIGCAPSKVSQWRTTGLKSYTKYLPQIAEVLGTTVQWLVTGEELPSGAVQDTSEKPDFLVKFNSLSSEDKEEILAIIEVKHARHVRRKDKT